MVFRGANGPWKTGENEYHLRPEAARDLVVKVLDTYRELHGCNPKELFIHGQTYYSDPEWHALLKGPLPRKQTLLVYVSERRAARPNCSETVAIPFCAERR